MRREEERNTHSASLVISSYILPPLSPKFFYSFHLESLLYNRAYKCSAEGHDASRAPDGLISLQTNTERERPSHLATLIQWWSQTACACTCVSVHRSRRHTHTHSHRAGGVMQIGCALFSDVNAMGSKSWHHCRLHTHRVLILQRLVFVFEYNTAKA